VARRRDRLEALAAEIDQAGGTALAVEADITDRTQAEAAVQQAVERFGRLDTLVNNAGLMLLGPCGRRWPAAACAMPFSAVQAVAHGPVEVATRCRLGPRSSSAAHGGDRAQVAGRSRRPRARRSTAAR
jgi:NADP-dependent 3-hydroxy acid dehydrogenase YdfG